MENKLIFIYDGECPFCSKFAALLELKSNLPDPKTHKFYFDYGTLGLDSKYEPYQLIVDSLMTLKGYKTNFNWMTKKFEGEDHNEAFWRARFHYPIEFFLKKSIQVN